MTTSRETAFLSRILETEQLPESAFVYYRGKLQNDIHECLLESFVQSNLSQRELADRAHKRPEVVSRYIGAIGNWTLDSIADFFLGMKARLKVSVVPLQEELVQLKMLESGLSNREIPFPWKTEPDDQTPNPGLTEPYEPRRPKFQKAAA